MISLGFLTIHPQQEVEYVTEIAKHASEFSIEIYRFTPFTFILTPKILKASATIYNRKEMDRRFLLTSFVYLRSLLLSKRLSFKRLALL